MINKVRVMKGAGGRRRSLLASSTLLIGGTLTPLAIAQELPVADEPTLLDEVVVTAQSVEQNLQDVPISVTAFTSDEIERARITSLDDYTRATPNVQATSFGNRSRSFLAIRGVTSFGGAVPYGIYVDGLNVVPGRLTRGLDQDLQDIERIEVLRGPQGTYFGRNTMAGAVNITSVAPDFETVSGQLTGDVSSFDTYYARGLINLPLSDQFAIRAIGFTETSDGYIENAGDGPGNGSESYGGRLRLRGELSEKLEMNLSISADRNESDNFNVVPLGTFAPQLGAAVDQINGAINGFGLPLETFPILPEAGPFPQNTDTVSNDRGVGSVNESVIGSARFDYEGNGFTLTSITGYVSTSYEEFGEEDFTNFDLITNREDNELTSWSQELRVSTSLSDTLEIIFGGLYAEDEADSFNARETVDGNPYNTLPPPVPPLLDVRLIDSSNTFTDKVTSTAVFGEAVWTPARQWELRLGGRFTSDDVESSRLDLLSDATGAAMRSDTFDAFTPRIALTYFPNDDTTLYGVVSSGYKVGGFNFSSNPAVPEKFNEETAVNYEAGAKFELAGRARLNIAAFYFDWSDVQVQGFDLEAGTSFIQNAGEAHSAGLEIELSAALTDKLRAMAGIGWLESEFDEFDNAVNSRTGQIVADASGTAVPAAPEWTVSGSLVYERPITSTLDGFAQFDLRHIADHFFSPLDENPIDAYTLANLSVGIAFDGFRVQAYADNLFDEEYFTGYKQGIHLSGDQVVVGEPTRLGVRVSKNF